MQNKNNIPIVFVHKGYSRYLEYVLEQARYSNPDTIIYLINDGHYKHLKTITHVEIGPLEAKAYPFEKIYRHYGNVGYNYLMFAAKRFYIFKEFMHDYRVDKAWQFDTDVMVYANLEEEAKRLHIEDYTCAFYLHPLPFMEEGLAHVSYFTYRGLCLFLDYMTYLYQPERVEQLGVIYEERMRQNHPAAFMGEMYVLYKFWEYYRDTEKILDMGPILDNSTYDYNICEWPLLGDHYEQDDSVYYMAKRIYVENNQIYCYHNTLGKKIKFHSLHFPGPTKMFLHRYYLGQDTFWRYITTDIPYLRWKLKKNLRLRTRLTRLLEVLNLRKPALTQTA